MSRSRPPVLAQQTFQQNESALKDLDLAAKFQFIHRTNMWGSPESTSGVGSTLDATEPIRRGIATVCRQFNVSSILDAPCGDSSWITAAELPIQKYIGIDVVPELIERNTQRYGSEKCEFRIGDLTKDTLPTGDLVLCRDCLVHLSFANIRLVLTNFRRSRSKYLLTTTFTTHDINEDIADGDWRLLNLEKQPFSFPMPMVTINEECEEIGGAYRDKSLALWAIAQLPI